MGLFDKFLVLLGARSVIKTIEKSQIEQQRRMQLAEMERLRLEEERNALLEMQEDYEYRIDEWRTKSMSCRTSSMKWSDYDMKDLPILWLIFNTKIGRAIVCFILAGAFVLYHLIIWRYVKNYISLQTKYEKQYEKTIISYSACSRCIDRAGQDERCCVGAAHGIHGSK